MTRLIATRGLPASGKTTWVKAFVRESDDPGLVARVSRDDIGLMLHGQRHYIPETEGQITAVVDATIEYLLREGVDVVVDATNLKSRYLRDLAELAWKWGAEFDVQDFTDTSVETCVERDRNRPDSVGADVIVGMYERYLKGRKLPLPIPERPEKLVGRRYEPDLSLPRAILVDVDGTVALHGDRSPYDTSRYHEDTPNCPVITFVREMFDDGHAVVFCSGRDEAFRDATETWLKEHIALPCFELHMRPAGDKRRDDIVKLELFDQHIRDRWNVVLAFDDRGRVVRAYRDALGLTVFQVADGDF